MAVTKSTRLLVVWMAASVCVVAALRPSHHHRPSSHHTALEPTDADAVPVPAPIVSVVETDTEIDAGTGTDTDANVAMSDIDYQKWFNSWKWGTSDVESLHKLYYHPYTQVTGALQTIQYPKCNNHHRGFCVSGLNTDQSTDARNGRMRYIKFRASYSGEKSPGGAYVMPVMTALYGNDKKFTGSLGSATPHKVVSGHIINSKLGAQHPSVNENPINFFVQTAASNTRSTWSDAEDIMKVAAEGCMNKNQPINNCDVIGEIYFTYADDNNNKWNKLATPTFAISAPTSDAKNNAYLPVGGTYSIELSLDAWKGLLSKLAKEAKKATQPKKKNQKKSHDDEEEEENENDQSYDMEDEERWLLLIKNKIIKVPNKMNYITWRVKMDENTKKSQYHSMSYEPFAHFVFRAIASTSSTNFKSLPGPTVIQWSNDDQSSNQPMVNALSTSMKSDHGGSGAWTEYQKSFGNTKPSNYQNKHDDWPIWSYWVLVELPNTWLWQKSGATVN